MFAPGLGLVVDADYFDPICFFVTFVFAFGHSDSFDIVVSLNAYVGWQVLFYTIQSRLFIRQMGHFGVELVESAFRGEL